MKNFALALVALIVIAGAWWFIGNRNAADDTTNTPTTVDLIDTMTGSTTTDGALDQPDQPGARGESTVIGSSVDGTDITAYHFGSGERELLLIGGIHGNDAPNTSKLAREFIDYLDANETVVPDGLTVTIIPVLNPDGADAGSRFNANNVDLNRNFACDWAATSMWRDQEVSGGSAAFSEPEAKAIRDYMNDHQVVGAIVYFAAEGKVYPSACEGAPSNTAVTLAATYAGAAGYPSEAEFDAYQINGDMVNWFAVMDVPAISVLLTDRTSTEWNKNLAGFEAVLNSY